MGSTVTENHRIRLRAPRRENVVLPEPVRARSEAQRCRHKQALLATAALWATARYVELRSNSPAAPARLPASLGVSVDVLLGLAEPRAPKKIATNRLERRLLEIEKLDPKAKRQITQLLDSFIEGQKLKQRVGQRSTARA